MVGFPLEMAYKENSHLWGKVAVSWFIESVLKPNVRTLITPSVLDRSGKINRVAGGYMRASVNSSVQLSLLDAAETAEYQAWIKKYRNTFARDHEGPYAIQWPGKSWKTRYKPVSDPLLKAHLSEQYWIAVKASWYPPLYFLDFDRPQPGTLERVVDLLGMKQSNYWLMTSPNYYTDGNFHLALSLDHHGKRVTHRLGYEALSNMVGRVCEVYPQLRRKFRLPLGRGQRLIADDGHVLDSMPWWEAMYWLDKIDPLPVEQMRFQMELPFSPQAKSEDNPRGWAKTADVRELYEDGLQDFGTRHQALWDLAVSLWRANWLPQDASAMLQRWIRKKHNGFSKSAIRGQWRTIDTEISRQVSWIWGHFRPYPDTPHNLEGYITREDLRWIAQVYPCDVVNQKRLFALVCYTRPRAHHDFVFIPAHVWREEIANDRTYHAFRQDLEGKGLLDSVMSYRHVEGLPDASYSRKFKLRLPSTSNEPIQYEGRNEQNYYNALFSAIGSVREVVALTGVSKEHIYRVLRRQNG